jgi:hypothetical protein
MASAENVLIISDGAQQLDAGGELENDGRQATRDPSSPLMLYLGGGGQLPGGAFEGDREADELDWRGTCAMRRRNRWEVGVCLLEWWIVERN